MGFGTFIDSLERLVYVLYTARHRISCITCYSAFHIFPTQRYRLPGLLVLQTVLLTAGISYQIILDARYVDTSVDTPNLF